MARLSQQLGRSLGAVRDLAYDLRPPLLDQLGLVKALQSYCEDFTRRTSIPVDFLAAGVDEAHLAPDILITLYRLVQEGLTNVSKHAGAARVTLRLATQGRAGGKKARREQ